MAKIGKRKEEREKQLHNKHVYLFDFLCLYMTAHVYYVNKQEMLIYISPQPAVIS